MPMNEIPPLNASALLKQYGLRADKKLGQNFLQDPFALEAIAATAEIQPTDIVLEIGPGLGSLTRYLAVLARRGGCGRTGHRPDTAATGSHQAL